MNYKQAYQFFGSLSAIARAIGYSRQGVYRWRDSGRIPINAQFRLEVISGGKLRADRRRRGGRG